MHTPNIPPPSTIRRTLPKLTSALGAAAIAALGLTVTTTAVAKPVGLDVDGDIYPDMVLGSRSVSTPGLVCVLKGYEEGFFFDVSFLIPETHYCLWGDQTGDQFGAALAFGKLRETYAKNTILIGAPGYDNGKGRYAIWYPWRGYVHSYVRGEDGVDGEPGLNDRLGSAVAVGDFDNDGEDDWVVGAPGDTYLKGGSVNVFTKYGANDAVWSQDTDGIPGVGETGDEFGASLAAGDLNCDGYDDLVIGVPGENSDTGRVVVIYGKQDFHRLSGALIQSWDQSEAGGKAEAGDRFGDSLAIGNFANFRRWPSTHNCNSLAVGAPYEDVGSEVHAGAVNIIYGSSGGLGGLTQVWHQNVDGIQGGADAGDEFGRALSIGNLNDDDYDDLIIGVPYENGTGYVQYLLGSSSGLSATNNLVWTYSGYNESGREFGFAVAGSPNRHVAVGLPGLDNGAVDVGGAFSFRVKGTTSIQNEVSGSEQPIRPVPYDRMLIGSALTTPRAAK